MHIDMKETHTPSAFDDFFSSLSIALHSRIITTGFWFVVLLVAAVSMAAQFSARQPNTVALDIGITVIRFTPPLLAILLVQELVSREFERKLYLTSFTYPRQRSSWLLGRVMAILAICATLMLVSGMVLALLVQFSISDYEQATPPSLGLPYLITLGFIAIDLLVIIAIATLIAVSSKTPSFVLVGTMGFLLIARAYTPIIELLKSNPYTVSTFADPRIYQDSLSMLSFLLPDLGRMDVRMIALYDKMAFMPSDWHLLLMATLAYASALLALSAWILNKREFS